MTASKPIGHQVWLEVAGADSSDQRFRAAVADLE